MLHSCIHVCAINFSEISNLLGELFTAYVVPLVKATCWSISVADPAVCNAVLELMTFKKASSQDWLF